jgi:hypothetical protein
MFMRRCFTADMSITAEEKRAIEQVAERLRERFPQQQPALVGTTVAQAHRRYDGRPIRDFVPVLVEREAREELDVLGKV